MGDFVMICPLLFPGSALLFRRSRQGPVAYLAVAPLE